MGDFVVSVFSVGIVRLPKLEMLNVIHHSEMVRRDAPDAGRLFAVAL
jgi:hypothetical protein